MLIFIGSLDFTDRQTNRQNDYSNAPLHLCRLWLINCNYIITYDHCSNRGNGEIRVKWMHSQYRTLATSVIGKMITDKSSQYCYNNNYYKYMYFTEIILHVHVHVCVCVTTYTPSPPRRVHNYYLIIVEICCGFNCMK